MNLTEEQRQIVDSAGNIKINAVAGSGKTSTLVEYAKSRKKQKALYLAFNKSVKLGATKRFSANGLDSVTVETAHSLAFRDVMRRHAYKVQDKSIRPSELIGLVKFAGLGNHTVLARHILAFVSFFCNSTAARVQDLDYLQTISAENARQFVSKHYDAIVSGTRQYLALMNSGECPVSHDFYLKKFQLSSPKLPFDLILFDEGQDASGAMLDVFLNQPATLVIVGDTHQQIYSWRFAVNSMETANFPSFPLSTSFRFGENIALLARKALELKKYLGNSNSIHLNGAGGRRRVVSRAVLARTNSALLTKAIDLVFEQNYKKPIYFEGGFDSYTYAQEGGSLYDVLNLYLGKPLLIRDATLGTLRSFEELIRFTEETEDASLGSMIDIVKLYGEKLPIYIKRLKERSLPVEERDKAGIIFSTVHRAKGLEYDEVTLAEDFITEAEIKRQFSRLEEDFTMKKRTKEQLEYERTSLRKRLNEEINLLYVALTRSTSDLILPKNLNKMFFPNLKEEHPQLPSFNNTHFQKRTPELRTRETPVHLGSKRESSTHSAYSRWEKSEEEDLRRKFSNGIGIAEISLQMGRSKGSIYSRLRKLGLIDENTLIDDLL